jgi:hypothetical protein
MITIEMARTAMLLILLSLVALPGAWKAYNALAEPVAEAPEAQFPPWRVQRDRPSDPYNRRLPNGKLQRDVIAKDQFEKNMKDAKRIRELADEIIEDLEAGQGHVVSLKNIERSKELEDLAKDLRKRLKSF